MTMRADISRNAETERNSNNQIRRPRFETVTEAVHCWVWDTSERTAEDANKTAVVGAFRGMVARSVDIREGDHFGPVKDRLERECFSVMRVRGVQFKRDHREVSMDRID
jgi:glutamate formiminotransferase